MRRLSNDTKYQSARPLRDVQHNQTLGFKYECSTDPLSNKLQECQKQNRDLKIKCAKIDQIQNYVNILVQQNEQLKKSNSELQKKNNQLKRELKNIGIQKSLEGQMSTLRLKVLGQETNKGSERKKNDFQDSFSRIQLQQQIAHERQIYQKMVGASQSKHQLQLQQFQHRLTSVTKQNQVQSSNYKRQIQQLRCDNRQLKLRVSELERSLNMLKTEDEKLELQLKRYMSLSEENRIQSANKGEIITKIKIENQQLYQNFIKEEKVFKMQLSKKQIETEKLQAQTSMLQRLTNQLKQQGAAMLLDKNQLKEAVLQLEQYKCSNMRHLQKIQNQLRTTSEKNIFLSTQLKESEYRHKHLIAALEKDNLQLKIKNQGIETDLHTKQNEIHDLINIVSTLEEKQRAASVTATHLKEGNIKMCHRLNELQSQIPLLQQLKKRCQQKQIYANETQRNYVEIKTQLVEIKLIYQKEKDRVEELDKLLQQQINNRKIIEAQNQRILANGLSEREEIIKTYESQNQQIRKKGIQRQNLISQSQKCIDQCEKVYLLQKKSHASSKLRIEELQQMIKEQQQSKDENKKKAIKQSLQQMESMMTQKYQSILNEQANHFKTKIKYLQSEIALIQKEERQPHSLGDI